VRFVRRRDDDEFERLVAEQRVGVADDLDPGVARARLLGAALDDLPQPEPFDRRDDRRVEDAGRHPVADEPDADLVRPCLHARHILPGPFGGPMADSSRFFEVRLLV
jgi:hypothetical protein